MSSARWMLLVLVLAARASAQPQIAEVLNGADFSARFSPGLPTTIFGSNLGPQTPFIGDTPGLTVTVNGESAPVTFSSATQVNFQIPFDTPLGNAPVNLRFAGATSGPAIIQVIQYAPTLHSADSTGTGIVLFFHTDGGVGSAASPAHPGEVIVLDVIGLGQTDPPSSTGSNPTTAALTLATPTVTIAGEQAAVLSSTLGGAPNCVGCYEVTVGVPGDLQGASYPISIAIASNFIGDTLSLPVNITGLGLSQSGFTFQAVLGGGAPSPSTFRLINATPKAFNFTLAASTVSGGSGWLSVSPATGTEDAQQSTLVTVTVNPAGLAPGDYYGQIRADATGVPNSPQFLSVVLNVSGPNVNPGPVVSPTGLVFVTTAGAASPAPEAVTITNLTNTADSFTAAGSVSGVLNWFTFTPISGSVAPNNPAKVTVTPTTSSLPAGVYRGALTLSFPQDNNTSRVVDLLLVVSPAGAATAISHSRRPAATAACTPTMLLPVFALLGNNFSTAVAWPSPLDVDVVDDCGANMTTGSVTVKFSNGDPPLQLATSGDGHWTGTWAPQNPTKSSLVVTAAAAEPALGLIGLSQVSGAAAANPDAPSIFTNGVVSNGSYSKTATPSPGELIAIFGSSMSDGIAGADDLPLPPQLKNATLSMAGEILPLLFTSTGQINAQLPFDIPPGTTQQLILQHGNRLSLPQPVSVGIAEPAIFTVDQSGQGQGQIYGFPSSTQQLLANAANPAKVGEVIVLYCTGLGAVTPALKAGEAVPPGLHNTVNPVTLTIGGIAAHVDFAGATPGFAGLYQINSKVPEGVVSGGTVPAVISVSGVISPPATLAVRQK